MSELNQKLGFDASSAIANLAKLNSSLKTSAAALTSFGAAARKASGKTVATSMKSASASVDKATASYLNLGKAATTAGASMVQSGKKGAKAGASISKAWGVAIRIVATQLLTRALGAVVQAFGEAIESAREFGIAISEVATISGGMLGTQQQMADQVLRLSTAMGKTAKDVAEGLYQTLSNQVVDASDAFGFLETAMKLATATASETKDAVNALSSVINSYGLSAADAGRISDQLFKTVELGRLRLSEIADVMGRVTPITAKLGISFEEVAAALVVQTRQGVQANTALTQLRAITVKLLKPTEALKEVYRKWGVEDGPAAIKTFGGLEGVLSKLSKEVNGNDAAMAVFLNRVRAMSGQMATMTEEGKRMRDATKEIGEALGATNKAFAEFVGSPAFELTKAQNAFNNELIKTGEALTGLATSWNNLKTNFLRGIRAITDGFTDDFAYSVELIAALNKDADRAIEESRKKVTKSVKDQLNKEVEATRQALAKVNVLWNEAVADVLVQTDQLKAKLSSAFSDINAKFRESFSGLSEYVKNAASEIEGAREQAAGLREELAGRQFDRKLEGLSGAEQFTKLFNRAAEGFAKAREEMSGAFTKEQKAAADSTFKAARADADRAEKIAQTNNLTRQIHSANILIDESLRSQADHVDGYMQRRQDMYPVALKAERLLTAEAVQREAIAGRIVDLYSDLQSAIDPAKQDALIEKLKKALESLKDLDVTVDAGKFMDSMGIPNIAAELGTEIDDALVDVAIDWTETVSDLRSQLENIKVDLRSGIPGGQETVDAASQQLGRKQDFFEGDAPFVNQALDKYIDLQQKASNAASDLQAAEINKANAIRTSAAAMKALSSTAYPAGVGAAGGPSPDIIPTLEPLRKLEEGYRTLNEQVAAGKPITEEQLNTLKKQSEQFFGLENASNQAKTALNQIDTSLRKYVQSAKQIDESQGLMDSSKLASVNGLLGDSAVKAKEVAVSMKDISTYSGDSATNAGNFNTNMQNSGGIISTLVNGWNSVSRAVQAAAEAAVRAIQLVAQAKAAAASAASFHGGQFLAAGGAVQGQDTIPAILAKGEFVSSADTTKKFFSELNAMNNGGNPVSREQGGSVTNVGDVNVTVQGGDSSQQTVREIGRALKREIARGTITLK